MHHDYNESNFLQKSADEWWNKNKDKDMILMETNWFQPQMRHFLSNKFGENLKTETNEARGSTDFLIFNIPLDCKVLTDKKTSPKEKLALEILEDMSLQSFQQSGHTRCGFLIGYDYRKEKIAPENRVKSIVERIKFKILGEKIIALMAFSGTLKAPSKMA